VGAYGPASMPNRGVFSWLVGLQCVQELLNLCRSWL